MTTLNNSDGSYKSKYSSMKTKLKAILYENELFQDELRQLQRELLDIYRDKETLLEKVIQFEDIDTSSSESECEQPQQVAVPPKDNNIIKPKANQTNAEKRNQTKRPSAQKRRNPKPSSNASAAKKNSTNTEGQLLCQPQPQPQPPVTATKTVKPRRPRNRNKANTNGSNNIQPNHQQPQQQQPQIQLQQSQQQQPHLQPQQPATVINHVQLAPIDTSNVGNNPQTISGQLNQVTNHFPQHQLVQHHQIHYQHHPHDPQTTMALGLERVQQQQPIMTSQQGYTLIANDSGNLMHSQQAHLSQVVTIHQGPQNIQIINSQHHPHPQAHHHPHIQHQQVSQTHQIVTTNAHLVDHQPQMNTRENNIYPTQHLTVEQQLSAEELEKHLESRRMEQAALLLPDWESSMPNEIFSTDSGIKFMAED